MTADFSRQRIINLQGSHHLSFFDSISYISTSGRGAFQGLVDFAFISPIVRTHHTLYHSWRRSCNSMSMRTAGGCTGYTVCAPGGRRITVSSFVCRPVRVPVFYGVARRCSYIYLRPSYYEDYAANEFCNGYHKPRSSCV